MNLFFIEFSTSFLSVIFILLRLMNLQMNAFTFQTGSFTIRFEFTISFLLKESRDLDD